MSLTAYLPQIQDSLVFFLLVSLEMAVLFVGVSFLVGVILEVLPPERVGNILSSRNGKGYAVGAGLGALTPFCSCSTIPMVVGMLRANAGFGPTMTFLFTSPLVNPLLIALLWLALGWKFTVIYALSALVLTMTVGYLLERFDFARFIRSDAISVPSCSNKPEFPLNDTGARAAFSRLVSNRTRQKELFLDALDQYRKFMPLIMLGIGIGAVVHGFVPLDFFVDVAGSDSPWAVPVSAVIGIPLYVRVSTMVPMVMPLAAKGVALGAIAALVIGAAGASLPEMVMLKRLVRVPLMLAFLASVFTIAVITGLVFNSIYA